MTPARQATPKDEALPEPTDNSCPGCKATPGQEHTRECPVYLRILEVNAELERAREEQREPKAANVIEAIQRVMRDLPAIGKTETSEQGYQYRGIEAVTAHAQTLMGRHGVCFVPRVEAREQIDFTINSRPWTETRFQIMYRVYGPGGVDDFIEVGPLWGYGRDNSDKGANKAMTQAFKYALLQVFSIGDKKDDVDAGEAAVADARPGEVNPETTRATREQITELRALVRELRGRGDDTVCVTEEDGTVVILGVTVLRKDPDANALARAVTMATAQDLVESLQDRLDTLPEPKAEEEEAQTEPTTEELPGGPPVAELDEEVVDAGAVAPNPDTGLRCPSCGDVVDVNNELTSWDGDNGERKVGCLACAPRT